ncbi:hypothetical protein CCP3SC1_630014 [Gammaproteobacteria bacterium]
MITEALFVLCVREQRHVARVSVLTSTEGADTVQNALLLTNDTPLERFCRDYGIQRSRLHFGPENVYRLWPSREIGGAHQPASLNGVMERVAAWCFEGAPPVVACVAGGRKDMAVLFAQVFALFARPEDRLVHLMISPMFENLAEFFYPPPKSVTLPIHRAGGVLFLNSADAQVEMIDIPLVRLRSLMDDETRQGLISLEMAQQRIQREVESLDPSLHVFLRDLAISYHGGKTVLPPKEFAVFLFFAQARKKGWGPRKDGWISGYEWDNSLHVKQLEENYNAVTQGNTSFKETGFVPRNSDGEINFQELKEKMTHAISKIKFRLGESHSARVQSRSVRGGKEYGLALDPRYIQIDEE